MRILIWIFRIIVFSLVLLFSFNNTDLVNLQLFPGFPEFTFEGPLIVWLFLAFVTGVIITLFFMIPMIVRNWRVHNRNAD